MVSVSFNFTKIQFQPRLRPDPSGGAYDSPPDPIFGWEGDTPPHSPPLVLLRPQFLSATGPRQAQAAKKVKTALEVNDGAPPPGDGG